MAKKIKYDIVLKKPVKYDIVLKKQPSATPRARGGRYAMNDTVDHFAKIRRI